MSYNELARNSPTSFAKDTSVRTATPRNFVVLPWPSSGGLSLRPEQGRGDVADSLESRPAGDAGRAGDGPVSGMDLRPPERAEAAGHLSKDDGGADLALGDVVGGADAPVLEEDEELAPPGFHLRLQDPSGSMRDGHRHQSVEATVRVHSILAQGAVLQRLAPSADGDRPGEQLGQGWRKHGIPTVDGVLHVAQNMGEADLLGLSQLLLASIAIGDPDIGPVSVHHRIGHCSGPAWGDLVQNRLAADKDPLPVEAAVDPGTATLG